MTIAELIGKLGEFDQSLPVMVRGFDECGLEEIGTVKPVRGVKMREDRCHPSMYDEVGEYPSYDTLEFDAILINF